MMQIPNIHHEPEKDESSNDNAELIGRGSPSIQERPALARFMAGKESWLPATMVGVIITVVVVISFYFLRDAHFSDSGSRRFDTKGNSSQLKASHDLGAAGDGGQAPMAPLPKIPDALPPPIMPMPIQSQPLGPMPAGANPKNRFDAPLVPNEGTGKEGQGNGAGVAPTMVQPVALNGANAQQPATAGTFDGNLKSTPTPRAQAGLIGNRNLLLAKGTLLDCVLNTAINSTIPGMVSCNLTRNVYSDNGKVLLLERGSVVTGEFGGRVKTGQSRIYVLWNRIKTPNGVVVNLDSPGADALGRSGIDGDVDKHWGERIGNAFLLSLIQDAIGFAATRGSNQNGSQQMYFQNTQQTGDNMASTVLKDSLQIPPTISKKQGERIAIFVARDLDFSAVYELAPQLKPN